MNKDTVLQQIIENMPYGADIVSMIQVGDSHGYISLIAEIAQKVNLEEFSVLLHALKVQTKTFPIPDQEPKNFNLYSDALKEAGAQAEGDLLRKFEAYVSIYYDQNFKFMETEFGPYLESLYNTNKPKFEQRFKEGVNINLEDPEVKLMMLLRDKMQLVIAKAREIVMRKPVSQINELKRTTEFEVLIKILTNPPA